MEDHPLSKTAVALLIIIAVGFAARLVFCAAVVGIDRAPGGDESDYHSIAASLADGDGYRLENGSLTARRPPLYPLLLSLLYRVFGPSAALARFFQVLLGTALIPLVFFAARGILTPRAAWIAAGLTAISPYLIIVNAYLLAENLYTLLMVAAAYLAIGLTTPLKSWRVIFAGLALGMAALCRPIAWLIAPWMVAAAVLLGEGSRMRRMARGFVLFLSFFLTILPWGIRNQRVFDRWQFFTFRGESAFYQGNNTAVLEHPQHFGGSAPLEMLSGGASWLDVGNLYSLIVIPLLVLGFLLGLWNRRLLVLLAGLIVVHAPAAMNGPLRMRAPIEPVIAIYAAYACDRVISLFRRRRPLPPLPARSGMSKRTLWSSDEERSSSPFPPEA